MRCKFCNGMGRIEINQYNQGNIDNPHFQLTVKIIIDDLLINCPKCNGLGQVGQGI